jgi:hypothetical protein
MHNAPPTPITNSTACRGGVRRHLVAIPTPRFVHSQTLKSFAQQQQQPEGVTRARERERELEREREMREKERDRERERKR